MPFLKQEHIEGGQLLLWEIRESLDELQALADEFTNDPAYLAITHTKRKREWLCSRLLLQLAQCSPTDLHYNEHGKPALQNPHFAHISISHSAKLAGLYLHPNQTIGIDIEAIGRDFSRVETRYLSTAERQLATELENGKALFWCIKEAAYKAAGIPGLIFNQQIEITKNEDGELQAHVHSSNDFRYKISQLKLNDQLIVCLTLSNE